MELEKGLLSFDLGCLNGAWVDQLLGAGEIHQVLAGCFRWGFSWAGQIQEPVRPLYDLGAECLPEVGHLKPCRLSQVPVPSTCAVHYRFRTSLC